MSERQHAHRLWYTRRDGRVRGPFPEPVIQGHILLGRLSEGDELSRDQQEWRRLSELPELIPEVMRRVVTDEDRARLEQARLHADERRAERRSGQPPRGGQDRRRDDRRRPEPAQVLHHRRAWSAMVAQLQGRSQRLLLPTLIITVSVIVAGGLLLWYTPVQEEASAPDCKAVAAPGVNWSYCHLEGLRASGVDLRGANLANANLTGADLERSQLSQGDLSFANLGAANLRGADLADAKLVGAVLARANLDQTDLRSADLSYANLLGARLERADLTRAVLGQAIWVDGRLCSPDSVGTCR